MTRRGPVFSMLNVTRRQFVVPMAVWLVSLSGCSEILWRGDLGGALRQSAKDGRLVMVYYHQFTNEACQKMNRTVFRSQDVFTTMAGTIPVRLDALLHRKWARGLGISRPPAFVMYDPQGQVLRIRQGFMDEAQFRGFIVAGKLNR